MPNWCHNTLTVTGDDVTAFVEAARPDQPGPDQPLSFAMIVPPPEDLSPWEEKVPCTSCGSTGTRPWTQAEAEAITKQTGIEVSPWLDTIPQEWADECHCCNDCHGTGESMLIDGWYAWNIKHWGTKWDAVFDGPSLALVAGDEVDVDASVKAQGGTLTPTVAVYKFDPAWSPPIPFVLAASEHFHELEFVLRYGEPGVGFAGEFKCVAGVTIHDEHLEVEEVLMPEEMWF